MSNKGADRYPLLLLRTYRKAACTMTRTRIYLKLCSKSNLPSLPGHFQNQVSLILRKLFIGIQEFDTVHGSIRGKVNVDLVANLDGRHLADFLVKPDVYNVVFWIVGQLHAATRTQAACFSRSAANARQASTSSLVSSG